MEIESSKIQALPSDVIDQIAAGEVVERPAHLAKELVENSLDADSTEISVEVSDGGRNLIVTDNGRGIPSTQLSVALDRHTTSKIRRTDDLWDLSTFGFRGEALASISSVSILSLSSRTKNAEQGFRIQSQFGRKSEIEKIGHSFGTKVQVTSLFENVPARLKFMKSAAGEVGAIRNTIKALSLSRPDVGFRFIVEGKLDLHFPVAPDRKTRAEQVLGVSPLYLGEASREGVRAFSVMADPHQTAKTSKNIWIFAQNRWIQDRSLQAAIMEAYRTLLMHGEYPFVVTWVETDPKLIDVNIHPSKSQVKFADASLAFRAVAASVRETLEKAPWIPNSVKAPNTQTWAAEAPAASVARPENLKFEALEFHETKYPTKQFFAPKTQVETSQAEYQVNRTSLEAAAESREAFGYWSQLQILGQADLTYLVCQNREGLVLVDQHAAQERVLFERIMRGWKSGKIEIQDFLFPLSLDFTPEKKEALLKYQTDLEKLGLFLEELGPETVGVKAAPVWIKENALAKVLDLAATQIVENGGSAAFEIWVSDLAATMACHSSIRAGHVLSQEEMRALLMAMDEEPMSSFCPHGRPVSVQYPFSKLEKDFGRTLS